jgi:hypothetical protein
MKIFSIFAFMLGFSMAVFAQNSIDILTVSTQFGTPATYTDNTIPEQANESIYNVNLKLPIVFKNKNIWYNDINYFNFQFTNNNTMASTVYNPVKVQALLFQTGYIHKLDENHALYFLLAPRLMGDFEGINSDNIQMGGIAMYEKRFSDKFTMRFGAAYNQEMGGPYMLPVVYLDWIVSDKWRINGMLPIYSKISYLATPKFTMGFHHIGTLMSFKLNADAYNSDYIERNAIDLSTFANYKITKNIHAEFRLGYALSRTYEQYNTNDKWNFGTPIFIAGDNRTLLNSEFGSYAFAYFRLAYSVSAD